MMTKTGRLVVLAVALSSSYALADQKVGDDLLDVEVVDASMSDDGRTYLLVQRGASMLESAAEASGLASDWVLLEDDLAPITLVLNGPEYGFSENRWWWTYSKEVNGVPEIFKAPLPTLQVTAGTARINQLPSKSPSSAKLCWLHANGGFVSLVCDDRPDRTYRVAVAHADTANFRWESGGDPGSLIYASTVGSGADFGQIILGDASEIGEGTGVRLDLEPDVQRLVTADPGHIKFDPYPFFGSDGRLRISCILRDADRENVADRLRVYVEPLDPGEPFALEHDLEIPADIRNRGLEWLQSPEPFVHLGQSYIGLTIKDTTGSIWVDATGSEVYVVHIESGEYSLQSPENLPGGPGFVAHELEFATIPQQQGPSRLVVYYNLKDQSGEWDLWVREPDLPCFGCVFADGFETGSAGGWSAWVPCL